MAGCGVETPTTTPIPKPTVEPSTVDASVESEVEGLVAGRAGVAAPPGFGANVFFPGLSNPSNFAVSGDGRVYVSEQNGDIAPFSSFNNTTT